MADGKTPRRPPSRVSRGRVVEQLRQAARRGDRASLMLAVDEMRTLALSPRYWQKYLVLLANPLARLVDLLVIKQGDRIAHQKGAKISVAAGRARGATRKRAAPPRQVRTRRLDGRQPSLFPDLLP